MSAARHEDLEGQLKKLYSQVPPPPSGLAAGRERMLAEAARLRAQLVTRPLSTDQTEKTERRRKMNLLFAYKMLAAVMAVALAVVGAGGGAVLAADSLPGDLVYPVKLAMEDIRLLLTTAPADRAELAMAFATERVQEMVRLTEQNRLVPDSVVARMTRQMEETIAQIAQSRPEEVPALLQRVMDRTRDQQQILEQARTTAREGSQAALGRASQVMERAHQVASAGLRDPERFQREYQRRHEGTLAPQGEPSPVNEPQRSQEEYQHRYEGTPGPHGQPSPSLAQEPQQSQYQYEGTPGPHGQASPSPTNEPQQSQEQHQYQYEGTPGPHGEPAPSPINEPQQSQEQHQYEHEGTPGPHGEPSPSPANEPQQSQEQYQQGGTPGPQGEQSVSPEATPSPPHGGPPGNGH
jgi:hypothetical protein